MINYLFSLLTLFSSPIQEAREEFNKKVSYHNTCTVNTQLDMAPQTFVTGSIILIRKSYWDSLSYTAKKVTVLRELLHCELGVPYMTGMSIMNKNITIAHMVYTYGAD